MIIRQEETRDYENIYSVVKKAFGSAVQADGNEQDLVNALRNGDAYIPELSLVARNRWCDCRTYHVHKSESGR